MLRLRSLLLSLLLVIPCLAQLPSTGTAQTSSTYANFEGAQTHPIRLSPDGTRLFAVNTAAATLSVFDVTQPASPTLIAQIPVGLEPVSVNPRTDDEAWVVNQFSNSISVVSVSKGVVVDTIHLGTEPMDVVFAGSNQAYVSISRDNAIAVVDTISHAVTAILPVFGDNPRALAVSPDGGTVYAAFALSGNGTTLIPARVAPPQPNPTNPLLPPPPQVGLIVKARNPLWSSVVTYTMPDNDVVAIHVGSTPTIAGYYSDVGTVNLGLAVNAVTGDVFVANTDARNLIHFEPNLRGHWVDNRITRIQVATGRVRSFDLNPGINYGILPNPAALATALAQPTDVAFDPSGQFMYVAAFGTDRVAVVDTNGNVLARIEVALPSGAGANVDPKNKRGPRGLALDAPAHVLYVLNRISDTISIVSTDTRSVLSEIPVGPDPTPPDVKVGRGFLYDAKLSGNGTGSCASCHVDGDMDHLAWDLGNPGGNMTTVVQNGQTFQMHPMKGPMTTQTLRGLLNLAPYHWRGDKADFSAFNAAFNTLMGGNELSSSDMSLFTTFINSLQFPPNPNENLDRGLPSSLNTPLGNGNPIRGRQVFINAPLGIFPGPTGSPTLRTCNSCHTVNPGPGTNLSIDPAISGTIETDQPLKIPQLRNVYQKQLFTRAAGATIDGFGMDHDGHVAGFSDFFATKTFALYSATQKADIAAFLLSLDTGTAPAVGYAQTLTASNVGAKAVWSKWALLEQQAGVGNIDLVAYGTINGQAHALLYQPSSKSYITDTRGLGPFTPVQLLVRILRGDTLTVMGVAPGTGQTFLALHQG